MNEDKGRITIRTPPMDADMAQAGGAQRAQAYPEERKRKSITYQLIHRLTLQPRYPGGTGQSR